MNSESQGRCCVYTVPLGDLARWFATLQYSLYAKSNRQLVVFAPGNYAYRAEVASNSEQA